MHGKLSPGPAVFESTWRCNSRFRILAAATVAVALFGADAAAAAPPPSDSPSLNTITVEAQRKHAELKREVHAFLSSVIVHHNDWSYSRWRAPICPLVAGLSRDQGEFMLARLSQSPRNAGAPLGSEKCRANFYVVVTREPDLLLKKWRRRDPLLFGESHGVAPVNRFINAPRPVRVWYNAEMAGADGSPPNAEAMGGAGEGGVVPIPGELR